MGEKNGWYTKPKRGGGGELEVEGVRTERGEDEGEIGRRERERIDFIKRG